MASYGKDGPQASSGWHNKEFQEHEPQIDREIDDARRKALIRKAEELMGQDMPLLPVSWEKIHDGWYSYVKITLVEGCWRCERYNRSVGVPGWHA
jgi:ABC-type transport system substrate-binding protein